MTSFEKDVIDRLGRIETDQQSIKKTLEGNGQPGLIQRHESLDKRVLTLENSQEAEKTKWGLIAGIVGFIANAVFSALAFFKH